jgi:hypothetical protein
MEFPGTPKQPHLQEEGYNAIEFKGAVDCWIRNVTVTDADNGAIIGGSRFCTGDGFTVRAAKRTGLTGHHAMWVTGRTQDSLFVRFRCDTTYVHDLTVEGYANGNVFASGSGVTINCDHHRNAPYDNLFTDIDVGDPRRLFESSGREDRGPHSGARTTFWRLRGQGKFPKLPSPKDWPLINVVGFGDYPVSRDPGGSWIEPWNDSFSPRNLWQAQVERRRKDEASSVPGLWADVDPPHALAPSDGPIADADAWTTHRALIDTVTSAVQSGMSVCVSVCPSSRFQVKHISYIFPNVCIMCVWCRRQCCGE